MGTCGILVLVADMKKESLNQDLNQIVEFRKLSIH